MASALYPSLVDGGVRPFAVWGKILPELPAQTIPAPEPTAPSTRLYFQAGRERDEETSSHVGLHFAGGGDVRRWVRFRESAVGVSQHQPGNNQCERLGGAIYGYGLLEHAADYGHAAKRHLGRVYCGGFHSYQRRHGFPDGPGDLRQRSEGNLHGFRVGSGLWLHGTRVPCDYRLRRGMRPDFCNGTADVPVVPTVAVLAAAREEWPPKGELFISARDRKR